MKEKSVKLLLAITKSNWGGAQRYVFDIANHFKDDKQFNITVLLGGDGDLIKKLHKINIRTISVPSLERDVGIIKDIRAIYRLYRTIKKESPDIIHLNSSKIGLFGAIIARFCGIEKIIFTAHAWPFNEARPLYQKIIFRMLGMLTVLFAHKTIAVSESVIRTLRAPSYISKKMTCIYTGIETPKLYEDGAFFNKFGIEKTKGVHMVSIGELHMSKGFDRALIALAKCKHLPWVYHIMGTGEKKEFLETLATQLEIRDRIKFYGFVENASLYLNSFDLFLFPSRTEALGYVAIEAIYTKLPIIASKAGGIPEVLFDDPYTKIIDCDDGKIFRETLLRSLRSTTTVDETKRPGRMRFLPKFMFTSTKKIYLS